MSRNNTREKLGKKPPSKPKTYTSLSIIRNTPPPKSNLGVKNQENSKHKPNQQNYDCNHNIETATMTKATHKSLVLQTLHGLQLQLPPLALHALRFSGPPPPRHPATSRR
mmetsp:Transcript_29763/g.59553  ORF Transcript_29763/g.59553 Transcript_29763/m.59553 type:complete len:110 (-) Transcript_29763:821-1150(-)